MPLVDASRKRCPVCGIAAKFSYNFEAPLGRNQLVAMYDSMAVRGPDGEGIWILEEHRIAMAYRRLSIIDLGVISKVGV